MAEMDMKNANQLIFALDIGTRSIIGMVGQMQGDKMNVIAIEKAEHSGRSMIDGQIENIDRVAALAREVKETLEKQLDKELTRVHIAAAGRALRTQKATYEVDLDEVQLITDEIISRLEAGAISAAEENFCRESGAEDVKPRFYLAGYTISQYYLDDYLMSSLKDHHGRNIRADIIATFLPGEVVESLYSTMNKIGLEVASVTLEPIAAINAVIPEELRLLNLALADIGAGTSDIAACRDGSVIGYTMATIAGDEITEAIMKEYLVDFKTAEKIKMQIEEQKDVTFLDVLGFQQTIPYDDVMNCIGQVSKVLCAEISEKIKEVNGGTPSAVFLSGGGSRLKGLREGVIECLDMTASRVALAGNNFKTHAVSEKYDLNNPEYATPIGILISAGLNLINDSFQILLNGKPAKLFRSGVFNARDLLMMNGYSYQDMIGRVGKNVAVTVNGKRTVFQATPVEPAVLRINGEDAKLSDIIHAGDEIEFHPAVSGVSPTVMLGDIEGVTEAKYVRLNGEPAADLETLLKFGDSIHFADEETKCEQNAAEEMRKKENKALEMAKEWMAVQPTPILQPVMMKEETAEAPAVSEESETPKAEEATKETEASVQEEKASEKAEEPVQTTLEEPAAPVQTTIPESLGVTFVLNEKPMSLPRRDKSNPYLLMDMLQYSGVDFTKLKGEVVLQVNGKDGYFQQPLKDGDQISIYEKVK